MGEMELGWRGKHGGLTASSGLSGAYTGLRDIDRSGLASKSHSDAGVGLRSHDEGFERKIPRVSGARQEI